jgi:diguanylate cyclase (GGDEF)-like protein
VRQLRLLLIEDSEDDAALVVRALTRGGYEVTVARVDTPEALIDAIDQHAWDVTVADYTMPRFSGTAALHLLRERDADMPFIFVSGTIGEDAAVDAMKVGAHDYIMKGNLKRLVPAVERELRDAAVRRERRQAEQRLAHLAYHDPLTDLPNRALLNDRLEQAVRAAHRDSKPLALVVMDLDGFKDVNDTLGHHAGDRVLQHVAARIRSTLREADTVARLGGDEFAVILPFTDADGAVLTAQKVLHEIDKPFVLDDRPMSISASLGISCFPEHGSSAQSLLQRADVAMYLAKSDRAGIAIYEANRDRHTHRRLTLISELRHGIEEQQFFVEYQPILNLRSGVTSGVEALVRWNHPTQGRVLPADFIDLAEQTGLIQALTRSVLDTAVGEWASVSEKTMLTVAINLSPRNLQDTDLPKRIADILFAHGMRPSSLALEITENVLMSDPGRSLQCLTALHDMGVRLVIDDFGTGYSSLSYLRRLPVNELKIDRSFVAGLATDEDDVIVRSTIDLAHNLGLTVIAEGVESDAAQTKLAAMGCDAAQGMFICAPAGAAELQHWIARQSLLGLL